MESSKTIKKGELSHQNMISISMINIDDLRDSCVNKKTSFENENYHSNTIINQINSKPLDNTLPTITNTINNSTPEKLDSDDSTLKKDNVNEDLELHSLGNSGDVEDIDLIITKLKYNKKYKRSNKRSNYTNSNNSNTVNLLNENSVSTVELKQKHEIEKSVEEQSDNAFINFVNSKKKSFSSHSKEENKIKSLLVKNNFEEQI